MGGRGDWTWLPVADWINMLSLSVTLVGVFVLPVLDLIGLNAASKLFGLAALLLAGYALALAGHYEMYNPETERSMTYFPFQERVVALGISLAVIAYAAVALSAWTLILVPVMGVVWRRRAACASHVRKVWRSNLGRVMRDYLE